MSDKVFKICAS